MNKRKISYLLTVLLLLSGLVSKADSSSVWKARYKQFVEDSAQSRHILIAYAGATRTASTKTQEQAKRLADSIAALLISKKASWEKLCQSYSNDPGSNSNGQYKYGNYGWLSRKTGMGTGFVKPFMDFTMGASVGDIAVVESEFGFHVMEKVASSSSGISSEMAIAQNATIRVRPLDGMYLYKSNSDDLSTEADKIVAYSSSGKVIATASISKGADAARFPCSKFQKWLKQNNLKKDSITFKSEGGKSGSGKVIFTFTAKR